MFFWGTTLKQLLGSPDACSSSFTCLHRLGLEEGAALLLMLFAHPPRFLVAHVSMTKKNPSQALRAAMDVGALREMNKWFVRKIPATFSFRNYRSLKASFTLGAPLFAVFLSCKKIRYKLLQTRHLLLQLLCRQRWCYN